MHCGDTKFSCCYRIVKKQQGYCSGGYARVVERSEKFDSIKYKDLRSEIHTYKSAIGSKRIENPYTIFRQIANQPAH